MDLAIGTAQFGMQYGVANTGSLTPYDEMVKILDYAVSNGLATVDTSPVYGNAERLLGDYDKIDQLRIISKIMPLAHSAEQINDALSVIRLVETSLVSLGVEKIYGLLVHHSADLFGPYGDHLYDAMQKMRDDGKVDKIGVSVYGPTEAQQILEKYQIDLIQIPMNPLNQAFVRSGLIERMAAKNIEIHVRSVFLQGLLLMSPDNFPDHLDFLKSPHAAFVRRSESLAISQMELAIAFLENHKAIGTAVVGVDSLSQLEQILASMNKAIGTMNKAIGTMGFADLHVVDARFTNPASWPAKVGE